jgi:hypothetical protein
MLLAAAIATSRNPLDGLTWEGNLTTPSARATSGCQVVGSALVAMGSAFLLASASRISVVSVLLLVASALLCVNAVMAVRLKAHLDSLGHNDPAASRSLLWCLAHPFWRPSPAAGPVVNLQDGVDAGEL